jgi:hypothetical protein
MSPEQAQGEHIDHRADLFSLGSVLYTMCTGRPPFRGDSAIAVIRRVVAAAPRPVSEINPDIPDWLGAIVAKLMGKRPEERYQTSAEVARVLEERLAALQFPADRRAPSDEVRPADRVSDRRAEAPRAGSRPRSLTPLVVALVGLALLLFCGGPIGLLVGYWLLPSGKAPATVLVPPGGKVEMTTEPRVTDRSSAPPAAVAPFSAEEAREQMIAWSEWLGVPVDSTNSIGMKLRLIPAGEFEMGSSEKEVESLLDSAPEIKDAGPGIQENVRSEAPARRVSIDRPFLIGVNEVTVAQFRRFA